MSTRIQIRRRTSNRVCCFAAFVFIGFFVLHLLYSTSFSPRIPALLKQEHIPPPSLTSSILITPDFSQQQQQNDALYPDSVILDIRPLLEECSPPTSHRQNTTLFYSQVLLPRMESAVPPLSPSHFVCEMQCLLHEPELEFSMRYLGRAKYKATPLIHLCQHGTVPLLVRIVSNSVQYTHCGHKKPIGTHEWFVVQRLLFLLTRVVQLPDLLFAFDNSDFSRPHSNDPHSMQWMYTEPGILRYVGDPSHPSLLWPTTPFVEETSHCHIQRDGAYWYKAQGCRQERIKQNLAWEDLHDDVFWRGCPNGWPIDDDHVQFHPRSALVKRFHGKPGFDVAFTNLSSCIPPSASKQFLTSHAWVTSRVERSLLRKYKMALYLDGHTAAWGLIQRFGDGSVLLHHESLKLYREFYYARLRAYQHFLPISFDFSNLERVREYVLHHPLKAKRIASQAMDLFKNELRVQDMYCYMFRLLTTLAAKQDFTLEPEVSNLAQFAWKNVTYKSIQSYKSSLL